MAHQTHRMLFKAQRSPLVSPAATRRPSPFAVGLCEMSATPRLEVKGLSKTFGTTTVLDNAELIVMPGEIHGLAGQNGSGKSTIIKLLTGVHAPDAGAEYRVDGNAMRLPVRWPQAHAAGVSVVHQDLGLLDSLSVAENICIGGFPTRFRRIDRKRRDELAARTLARLGIDLNLAAPVETLTAAQRAEVAIARAMRDLRDGSGLIILDESTRALTGEDLERVHAMLRRLAATGSSAVMISHNLGELMSVTDRITILRDGKVVGAGLATSELDEQEIARRMLGGSVDIVRPRELPRVDEGTAHECFRSRRPGPREDLLHREARRGPRDHRPARKRLRAASVSAEWRQAGIVGRPAHLDRSVGPPQVVGRQMHPAGSGARARAARSRWACPRADGSRQHHASRAQARGSSLVRRPPLAGAGNRAGSRRHSTSGRAIRRCSSSSSAAATSRRCCSPNGCTSAPR